MLKYLGGAYEDARDVYCLASLWLYLAPLLSQLELRW